MCPRFNHGFTLLEVLAALLITGVALTYLIQSETESVRNSNLTRDMREATMLGYSKLQELVAGVEPDTAGKFEDRADWTWEAVREPFSLGYGAEKYIITVSYVSAGKKKTLTLEQVTR